MKAQMIFISNIYESLRKSVKQYLENGGNPYLGGNYMNKNHGPTAIKRKITMLRQELLNLERMIDT